MLDFTQLNLADVLVGAVMGFALVEVVDRWRRPRIRRLGFARRLAAPDVHTWWFDDGELFKFWFELRGRAPGDCSLELTFVDTEGKAIVGAFAKWDETPNPTLWDQVVPEKVPETYHQPVHVGRLYTLPVIWRSNDGGLYLFCGALFEEKRRAGLKIDADGWLRFDLTGGGLRWRGHVRVDRLLEAEAAASADSHSKQQLFRAEVATKPRMRWRRSYSWGPDGIGTILLPRAADPGWASD